MQPQREHISLLIPVLILTLMAGLAFGADWHKQKMKSSWPHLTGPRDTNYDNLIVPGSRVGPVVVGGTVSEAVRHLGNPDYITMRPDRQFSDEVHYHYKGECLGFYWADAGIEPTVNGLRGINVTCDKWRTSSGVHVGIVLSEGVKYLGAYCSSTVDGEIMVATREGLTLWAKDRYSPIDTITIVSPGSDWQCK